MRGKEEDVCPNSYSPADILNMCIDFELGILEALAPLPPQPKKKLSSPHQKEKQKQKQKQKNSPPDQMKLPSVFISN